MQALERSSEELWTPTEPRWPAFVALLAVGGLHFALPSSMSLGPDWLLIVLVAALGFPQMFWFHTERHQASHRIGYAALVLVTLDVLASLLLLLSGLPSHRDRPRELLVAAAGLWISNILIFASWYWHLDAGGPHQRDRRSRHTEGAFLFPQMILDPHAKTEAGYENWKPGFVDYLFLSFNTSTAFSPTDVPVLSRWAKAMMMVQALISLATVVVLAARAVNIL